MEPPKEIILEFNEPVSALVMQFSAGGAPLADIEAENAGPRIIVRLPEDVSEGVHLLSWRVVSLDGHPVGGSLVYAVGDGVVLPVAAGEVSTTARPAAVARLLLALTLVLGVGSAVFAAFVLPAGSAVPRIAAIGITGSLLIFPAAVAAVGTQGLDMLGLPLGGFGNADAWKAGMESPTGRTALLAGLAAILSLGALASARGGFQMIAAGLAWVLAAMSFVASSHAALATPNWLASLSLTLHAAAQLFWMGALVPILLVLVSGADVRGAIRRFSAIAVPVVIMLVATGAVLTLLQSGTPTAWIGTSYGTVLTAKLVGVGALLGLASYNKLSLTPALEAGEASAGPRLGRTVRVEILVGLVVLALAAGFRLTVPPRNISNEPAPVMEVVLEGRNISGLLSLSPASPGTNTATVMLKDANGALIDPRDIDFSFSAPDLGVEPIRVPAIRGEDGQWSSEPFLLPVEGEWIADVEVLISDFSEVRLRSSVHVH